MGEREERWSQQRAKEDYQRLLTFAMVFAITRKRKKRKRLNRKA
jgi:hypothetical protein